MRVANGWMTRCAGGHGEDVGGVQEEGRRDLSVRTVQGQQQELLRAGSTRGKLWRSTMSLPQSLNMKYESRLCRAMWVDEWWT